MAIFWSAVGIYVAIGVIAALAFVSFGVTRVQPQSVTFGARILLFPGAAVLWPCVLARWRKSTR